MMQNRTEGFVKTPAIRQEKITPRVIGEHVTDRTAPNLRAVRLGQYRRHARRR
jgi:hypothetical protein